MRACVCVFQILEMPNRTALTIYKFLLQNPHPKIEYTMEHSFKYLPFLDILIENANGQITTDIYHKPTDTQHHTLCSICTSVTKEILRNTHQEELRVSLYQRRYQTILIHKEFELTEKYH